MPREIRGVMGVFGHREPFSSGSAITEAAKHRLGVSSGPVQVTVRLCDAAYCIFNSVSETTHFIKRWVTEDNYKWGSQPKRKQKVYQEKVKILGGAPETVQRKR